MGFRYLESKIRILLFVIGVLVFVFHWNFVVGDYSFAQDTDLEFSLDIASETKPLPKIFKPNIDLSGRGFNRQSNWPQEMAAKEVLDIWQSNFGFGDICRLQYNLWNITQLDKDKNAQDKLLASYESVIKRANDAGAIVILDIFGMPQSLGKVRDKKSAPRDLKAFKNLVKSHIRNLSCDKKYRIWYEVWNAPDLDDFFLGGEQEYLNIYKAVAEAVKELEKETKLQIPLGGPSVSWWFRNTDSNTILTPERSLIYKLIKFCYRNQLPLDFISWHGYSTDPKTEQEITIYNKTVPMLIRDWLTYFHFDPVAIPLIVSEWNFDFGVNVSPERHKQSNVTASYIISRLKNMVEAGLDYQIYFCLEDFQGNKENVVRNIGVFWFDPKCPEYKGGQKSIFNAFLMLAKLGKDVFVSPKLNDEFVGAIATKQDDTIVILIYNYIDPDIAKSYISKSIAGLDNAERRIILDLIKSGKLNKILSRELDISTLRINAKIKALLNKLQELNSAAVKFTNSSRNLKIGIKNLKDIYLYQRYAIDSSCSLNCDFKPMEEKEIAATDLYQELLVLSPYSVNMIVLKKKPREIESQPVELPTAKGGIPSSN